MSLASCLAAIRGFKLEVHERRTLAAFLVVALLLSVVPVVNTIRKSNPNKDYGTWYTVGHLVRENKPIYPPEISEFSHNFFYPPAIASLLYAPVSYAGKVGLVLILCALSAAGHVVTSWLSVYFVTGRIRGQPMVLYVVPYVLSVPFWWDIYILGQLNLTLLGVMMLGFVALEHKRPVAAGACLALSAAAKAFPLTAIGYLIWRRHWVAVGSMLATLVLVLVILPSPIRGFDRNLQELTTWTERMLLNNTGQTLANQPDRGYRYGNQTLLSVVHRLTRPLPVGKISDGDMTVNFVTISARSAFLIFIVLAGGMCLAYVWAMPPRGERTRRTNAIEYSILLILIVVFSPKAGSYYYCWMIPGFTVVMAELLDSPKRSVRRRWILAGFGLSVLVLSTALTQHFDRHAQGMGATMWGSVILFVLLVGILRDRSLQLKALSRGHEAVSAGGHDPVDEQTSQRRSGAQSSN